MKQNTLILIFGLLAFGLLAQDPGKIIYKGQYLGQKPPGVAPEVFLPEYFNQYGYLHGKLVFAPGGNEISWIITTRDNGVTIYKSLFIKQNKDGSWSSPEDSFFSSERSENGPGYSSDGNRLYYQSRSSFNGAGGNKDIDIWYRERKSSGWGEPVNIGKPVNSPEDDSQPWVTSDGSIFFCRNSPVSENGDKGGYLTEHGYNNSSYYWVSTDALKYF